MFLRDSQPGPCPGTLNAGMLEAAGMKAIVVSRDEPGFSKQGSAAMHAPPTPRSS